VLCAGSSFPHAFQRCLRVSCYVTSLIAPRICKSYPLRRQLAIVQRKLDKPVRVSRAEKFTLALLAVNLRPITGQTVKQLGEVIRIFQPDTLLRWHRD
jgi:hypothetical protein